MLTELCVVRLLLTLEHRAVARILAWGGSKIRGQGQARPEGPRAGEGAASPVPTS